MKIDLNKLVDIRNKSATYEFEILDKITAGIVLTGTEIKSIRNQKVNVQDSFCQFKGSELYLVNLHIGIYKEGTYNNHISKRERKLLLKKSEIKKWKGKMEEKGLTIVLTRLFINESGRCKVEIALSRGKKLHDKRASIKARDLDREMRKNLESN
jgi:SsrA-binding protein